MIDRARENVEQAMGPWFKWALTAALSVAMALYYRQADRIEKTQDMMLAKQTEMLIQMAQMQVSSVSVNTTSLHNATQIEQLRTEIIDVRMRINTIEQIVNEEKARKQ